MLLWFSKWIVLFGSLQYSCFSLRHMGIMDFGEGGYMSSAEAYVGRESIKLST